MTRHLVAKAAMTADERSMRDALAACTFLPGTFDKRFARGLASQDALSDGQRRTLVKLRWKYRRQISATVPLPYIPRESP